LINGYFITGSDTGVGKTRVGCQLIQQLRKTQNTVKVRKPVESGCKTDKLGQLAAADGQLLSIANAQQESPDIITPYRYRAALAPDHAARLEGQSITLSQLNQAVRKGVEDNDLLVVEGAGGFLSPICSDGLNADLGVLLGLPTVIVVEDRLGAINQALLTINAVEQYDLEIFAIILNQLTLSIDPELNNKQDLQTRIEYPVYLCPFNGELETICQ
jgi:dethiobiotin synthetase